VLTHRPNVNGFGVYVALGHYTDTSALNVSDSFAPGHVRIAASGLMNAGLPPLFFIRSSPAVNISETPKSHNFTCVRSALSKTLSG
jgi:hypothetical protein